MGTPRIDGSRLASDLERLSRIGGQDDGGVTRLAFSAEDRKGRDFVQSLLNEIGVGCRIDAVGNLLAVRDGSGSGLPVVLTGSHTDTVGAGGRFDGALGVLAGVAVLRALQAASVRTRLPVGVISFVNEEGVRFMPDMMGSLFVRGNLSLDQVRAAKGTDGTSIGEEIDRHGMSGPDDFRELDVSAFIELHIEQGPVLDAHEEPVAVVAAVQGLRWLQVDLSGASNHAGTTPMEGRRDAGVVAARIAAGVRELAGRRAPLRATCGRLVLEPNLVNVIPRSARLTVDLRHPDADALDAAEAAVRDLVRREAGAEVVQVSVEPLASAAPVSFDPRVVATVERSAAALGLPCRRLVSGAGHDAQIMSAAWPTAMIFVRSRNGISHSPAEWSAPEDVLKGADLLLRSVLELAG